MRILLGVGTVSVALSIALDSGEVDKLLGVKSMDDIVVDDDGGMQGTDSPNMLVLLVDLIDDNVFEFVCIVVEVAVAIGSDNDNTSDLSSAALSTEMLLLFDERRRKTLFLLFVTVVDLINNFFPLGRMGLRFQDSEGVGCVAEAILGR